jgi:REP element-mobilizing transposase RayT
MGQSLSKVILHSIFSTKNRYPFLDDKIRNDVHAYMTGIMRNFSCPILAINGTSDHIHILFVLSRSISQSKIIEEVKKNSSKWIKSKGEKYHEFFWQRGYGIFSIGESGIASTKKYIALQNEHHQRKTFQEEYRDFLKKYRIEYDENYVWD